MINHEDFDRWYSLESSVIFGIPCSSLINNHCACAGAESDLILIFLPGELEYIYSKTGKRFNANKYNIYNKLFHSLELPKGCGSCPFGPQCTILPFRPIECRLFPVAPGFLNIGEFYDHCPFDQKITSSFINTAKIIWEEIEIKAGNDWLEFYKSFIKDRKISL